MYGSHDDLINLAKADAANIETMMSQCKTISNLTASVAALTQKLQQANTGYNRGSGIPVDRQGQANPKWVNGKLVSDVVWYCLTHGHCVDISHYSRKCWSKWEGHRENATRANNMGGNPYVKPRAWGRERVGEIISNTKMNISHNLRVINVCPIADGGAALNCLCMNSPSNYDKRIEPIRALLPDGKKINTHIQYKIKMDGLPEQ